MIVPVMAISDLKLTQQIYSEETNGTHAHDRDRVPLNCTSKPKRKSSACSHHQIWSSTHDICRPLNLKCTDHIIIYGSFGLSKVRQRAANNTFYERLLQFLELSNSFKKA